MKLYMGEATEILFKTMPYVLTRMLVYFLFGIAAVIYFSIFFLIGYVFKWNAVAVVLFAIATAGFFIILRLVREYVLYIIKAGHVAVITELITAGQLPPGVNQVDYGKQQVKALFKEVSVLFVVDRLVNAVLRTFTRWTVRVASWVPIPGLESVARFAGKVAQLSVGFIDEAILSYTIAKRERNMWQGAKEGIILFCQQWKPILTNAAIMALITYVAFFVIFLPGIGIAALMPHPIARFAVGALFLVIALVVKFGFVGPLALISTIVTFQKETAGLVPDPQWETKLDGISRKFREISDRARSYVPPSTESSKA